MTTSAGRSSRMRRLGVIIRAAAIAAILAGSAAAIYAERATVSSGVAAIRHVNFGWLVVAFAAECVSMVAFAQLQQGLLGAAGTRLGFGSLLAIVYTSNAISVAVPVAGSGMATAYSHRQFRARGAEPAAVSLVLLIAGVISTVAFAVIAAIGAIASGNPAAAVSGLVISLCAAVAAGLLVIIVHSPRGRARLQRPTAGAIRLTQRLVHRPAGDPAAIAAGSLQQLGSFNLSLPLTGYAFGCALINWTADLLCLAAVIAAIGVAVPWGVLVLVWGAGVAATGFSPTPYGLGIVDIALITALAGAGLRSADAVGAVLLYRILTFKILVTLPWIGYQYLHNRTAGQSGKPLRSAPEGNESSAGPLSLSPDP